MILTVTTIVEVCAANNDGMPRLDNKSIKSK